MRVSERVALAVALAVFGLPSLAYQRQPAKAQPERKPQAALASKGAFGAVSPTSPELKRALEAHDIAGARKLMGKEAAFHGTVAKVFAPKYNALVILNFDPDYKKALVAVVKAEDFARFPDLNSLKDKHVLVRGKFVDFRGTPELTLSNASQVKIVK